MIIKRIMAISLFFIFALSSAIVMAGDLPKVAFSKIDSDKDGNLTNDEFMASHMDSATKLREIRFNQLDQNQDGTITRDEFMNVNLEEARKVGENRFKKIDKNGDGVLSEQEVTERYNLFKQSLELLK